MAHHFGGFFVQTLQPLTQRRQRPFMSECFVCRGTLGLWQGNDERTGLYRTAINAYSHDHNHEV